MRDDIIDCYFYRTPSLNELPQVGWKGFSYFVTECGEGPLMLTLESRRFLVMDEVFFCIRTLPNR